MKKDIKGENVQLPQLVVPFPLLDWATAREGNALKMTPENAAFLKALDAEILSSHQKTALRNEMVDAGKLEMPPEQLAQVKHIVLLTMKQTAAILNVTPQYIYKMIGDKTFPEPVKLGRMTRFRLTDLEQYIESRPHLKSAER
ncbi:hypothetical protein CB172_13105 [Salmonella enterica subsp. enterica serovar Claibornei]|nr:hypothetical protein [Salmonella enterica subsp. enterica serovar Claibornei]